MNLMSWIDKRQQWWKVFVIIFTISISVVGYIGYQTYEYAPPLADFRSDTGELVFSGKAITDGQQIFLRYGLMDYGTFLGDGALRGPDFTAEALNRAAKAMNKFHEAEWLEKMPDPENRKVIVQSLVQAEIKENRYDEASNTVTLTKAQVAAWEDLLQFNTERFAEGGPLAGKEAFKPENYITDPQEIADLTAFFYWGGWLCGAERPGFDYSYTQNWPFDPLAGNAPAAGVMFWSVIGGLVLILSMGLVFYLYGKLDREAVFEAQESKTPPMTTIEDIDRARPTQTQRACYKFMAVASLLFLVQILAGLMAISDFVGLFDNIGIDLTAIFPVTVTRAWHSQISVLWIAVCWFAASIWVLPLICRPEPKNQLAWINGLFWMLVIVALGTAIGIPLGVHGFFGDMWRWFGNQGWEFMQLGRVFQYLLYAAFVVWFVIVYRGLWPVLRRRESWSLPNWMIYSIAGIIFMFTAGFVANTDTNFVIADFWRWCTIHMWVEAFFELFTTVLLAYFLYIMGFVSHMVAARIVYLSAILFLGSGLIGISHNFYWNAKSVETLALGGVLSTLQITPLVLLTVEAWKFRHMPQSRIAQMKKKSGKDAIFGLGDAFLFLVGVNFWNFMGAGVLGFMINLPIVNYYQHATYLTVNHGHAALFGVYGNLAIASMLFCGRWVIKPEKWNGRLVRRAFWWLNLGLVLMLIMDLFPVGVHQLWTVMDEGYAFARSQDYIHGEMFQRFTWLRGFGVAAFTFGGVLPLVWFMVTRWFHLKPKSEIEVEPFVVPPTVLAVMPGTKEDKN